MPEVQSPDAPARHATADVQGTAASFADLLLPPVLVRSLHRAGFWQPSPVQQAAIPLGRFGADLIVQAKSGTGKTVTFGIIVADAIKAEVPGTQALIVEPTREVALQVQRTVSDLCRELAVQCCAFVGGLPMHADVARLHSVCQVVVGTPGRLRALLHEGHFGAAHIRLLVLDEADTLLAGGFVDDIAYVYGALPARKQARFAVLAFSATYTEALKAQLRQLTSCPQEVMLCAQTVALQGVKQLYVEVAEGVDACASWAKKETVLMRLLSSLTFNQALVFCNHRTFAEALADRVTALGYPAAFTCGSMLQRRRMSVIEAARAFRLRVLVSTDLNARGLDLPYVNLVINMDVPANDETYMHRVGRTGRFGTCGVAVSLVTPAERLSLQGVLARANAGELVALPAAVPSSWYAAELPAAKKAALQELQGVRTRSQPTAHWSLQDRAGVQADESHDVSAVGSDGEAWAARTAHEPEAADGGAIAWATWQQQQAAYSYWWWQHCASGVAHRPQPWTKPPRPAC